MSFGNNFQQEEMMSEINVTPLVDVMLVLLVVFIVTAPLLTQAVTVNLPKTAATAAVVPRPPHTVHLAADGSVRLDQTPLSDPALAQALAAQVASGPPVEIRLHADQHVPYGRVADIMALAQQAGVEKLSFVTQRK